MVVQHSQGLSYYSFVLFQPTLRINCAKALPEPCAHPFAEITESLGSSIGWADSFSIIEIP
ncbi:hypothetical protein [Azospirillum palustre]